MDVLQDFNFSSPQQIRRTSRQLAMLDALLCQEWDYRYYSFNQHWAPGEEMASMRDGSGTEYFILSGSEGMGIKVVSSGLPIIDQQKLMVARQLVESSSFLSTFLAEPAFSIEHSNLLLWNVGQGWKGISQQGFTPDLAQPLEMVFAGNPETYLDWAKEYYEIDADPQMVRQVFLEQPLDINQLQELLPDLDLEVLQEDLREIGYPVIE